MDRTITEAIDVVEDGKWWDFLSSDLLAFDAEMELHEALDAALTALWEREEWENPKLLTLDELLEMDGEPVWIDDWFEDFHGWELSEDAADYFDGESREREVDEYGRRWVAYSHKPKEV